MYAKLPIGTYANVNVLAANATVLTANVDVATNVILLIATYVNVLNVITIADVSTNEFSRWRLTIRLAYVDFRTKFGLGARSFLEWRGGFLKRIWWEDERW